jgi:hypothetical protein
MTPCSKSSIGGVNRLFDVKTSGHWNVANHLFVGWVNDLSRFATGGRAPMTIDEKAVATV